MFMKVIAGNTKRKVSDVKFSTHFPRKIFAKQKRQVGEKAEDRVSQQRRSHAVRFKRFNFQMTNSQNRTERRRFFADRTGASAKIHKESKNR